MSNHDNLFSPQWSQLFRYPEMKIRENRTSLFNASFYSEMIDGNYTSHDPISIDGDNEFNLENGVTSGNGTINHPYIIEGWKIVASTPGHTDISIQNTRAYFIVRECLLEEGNGISMSNVSFGTLDHLIIFNSNHYGTGVGLMYSSNLTISNSWIDNCFRGINAYHSQFVLEECLLTNNSQGIIILSSQDVTLKNNSIQDNTYPFFVYGSTMEQYYLDIDLSNTIDGKPIYYLCNVNNSTITGSMAIGFLALINCTNITINEYSPTRSGIGVLLAGTCSSTVSSCIFQNTDTGIILFNCSHNVIRNCEINASVPDPTILIINSPYTVFRNNTIHLLDSGGLYIDGETDEAYYQDIDTSNVINGKPIYYLIGVNNKIFKKSEVGYLALINCYNLFVTNLDISNKCQAMLLVNTKAIITKCKFSCNMHGVSIVGKSHIILYTSQFMDNRFGCVLKNCSETVISQCQFTGNAVGFDINSSHDNIIKKCLITDSKHNGFQIRDSWNNCLCGNNISRNMYGGIDLRGDCWGNELCGNTFSDGDHGILLDNEIPWNPAPPSPHHNNIHHNAFYQLDSGIVVGDFADDNTIHHNDIYGNICGILCMENSSICENNIYQNHYGAFILYCMVDAKRNWWGSTDGPSGDGPGNGDSIRSTSATVIFEPWLKHAANTKLTIFQSIIACLRVHLRSWLLYKY